VPPSRPGTMENTKQGHESRAITDHEKMKEWAASRNGKPARVRNTGGIARDGRSGGILRIDFGEPEATLEPITWEEFFKIFDENDLAFLCQEKTAGGKVSRFFKFIDRDSAEIEGELEKNDEKKKMTTKMETRKKADFS